jgi:ABC-2 type transport system ATP-binding protein
VHAIEVTGARKRFGATLALDDVTLRVEPGEVVALLGPNGAGKSTFVDVLLGLVRPDAGAVRLWGLPPPAACRAGRIGAMLQQGGLLGGLTVRELVEVVRGLAPSPRPLAEVLDATGVAAVADRRCDRLSGGQAQRVRFALAIAGDPDLLVLDEPTAAMDVASRRAFWSSLHAWTERGRTVLFATHHLEEADAHADRTLVLARGRLVADGPTSEVRTAGRGRTIRAVVPGAGADELGALPGVTGASVRGRAATLRCADSDAALRALLARWPEASEVEVAGTGLEAVFLALTDEPADGPPDGADAGTDRADSGTDRADSGTDRADSGAQDRADGGAAA